MLAQINSKCVTLSVVSLYSFISCSLHAVFPTLPFTPGVC